MLHYLYWPSHAFKPDETVVAEAGIKTGATSPPEILSLKVATFKGGRSPDLPPLNEATPGARILTAAVPGELEKGNVDRLLPIAPEFALFLLKTPEAAGTGPVFRLEGRQGRYRDWEVSKIGKAAGVKVYVSPKDPEKVKYASAHDFRRAFGVRWAAFEAVQWVFAGPFANGFANSAPSGGAEAAPPEKPSAQEITEPTQTRPGVIRTHDQGIMSGDEPEE